MSMKTVKAVMKAARVGMLATTDGKRAGVRPMGGWVWAGKELWCAAGASSDKVREIAEVPRAEYCFLDPRGRHVRLAGRCAASGRLADKQQYLVLNPGAKDYVGTAETPGWVVLRLKPTRIRLMTGFMKYRNVRPG